METEINEWLSQFEENEELDFVVGDDGRHFIMAPDTESEHAPDADAYVIEDLTGTVDFAGGE